MSRYNFVGKSGNTLPVYGTAGLAEDLPYLRPVAPPAESVALVADIVAADAELPTPAEVVPHSRVGDLAVIGYIRSQS